MKSRFSHIRLVESFEAGALVRLRSGGPVMTVEEPHKKQAGCYVCSLATSQGKRCNVFSWAVLVREP
jgi:uncharacterized protein YodC (DUF2158 family)